VVRDRSNFKASYIEYLSLSSVVHKELKLHKIWSEVKLLVLCLCGGAKHQTKLVCNSYKKKSTFLLSNIIQTVKEIGSSFLE
jgi:hypothetical protein